MYTTLIEASRLHDKLNDSAFLVIDIRYDLMNKAAGRAAYHKGHIPGAVYLDISNDLSAAPGLQLGRHPLPSIGAMNALFANLGITKNTQVVVYDDTYGSFAARAWWMLNYMSHNRVALLDGGWQAWLRAGYLVDRSVNQFPKSDFDQQPNQDNIVLIDEVQNYQCIVDSREPSRYKGEFEPIDPVAGHIPGAVNRFWKNNLIQSGFFKDKQVLKNEFIELLADVPAFEAVFYCGSGISACHNLLAVVHAGLPLPKLYAGSWSEWCHTQKATVAI